ncbi:unnamed protein product, partial [Polarella glacialis]
MSLWPSIYESLTSAGLLADGLSPQSSNDATFDVDEVLQGLAEHCASQGFSSSEVTAAQTLFNSVPLLPTARWPEIATATLPAVLTRLFEQDCGKAARDVCSKLCLLGDDGCSDSEAGDDEDGPEEALDLSPLSTLPFGEFLIWARRLKCNLLEDLWLQYSETMGSKTMTFEEFHRLSDDSHLKEGFTKAEADELRCVFKRFDRKCTGSIKRIDFVYILRRMGFSARLEDIQTLMNESKLSRYGTLAFKEFLLLVRLHREADTKALQEAYHTYAQQEAFSDDDMDSSDEEELEASVGKKTTPRVSVNAPARGSFRSTAVVPRSVTLGSLSVPAEGETRSKSMAPRSATVGCFSHEHPTSARSVQSILSTECCSDSVGSSSAITGLQSAVNATQGVHLNLLRQKSWGSHLGSDSGDEAAIAAHTAALGEGLP